MLVLPSRLAPRATSVSLARSLLSLTALALAILAFSASSAMAGASSGQLFFYPCTSCHPITFIPGTEKSAKPLPNGFEGHQIALVGHDKLGVTEDAACLACHDDPARNPGLLKSVNGSLIDIKTGDISTVCERCHSSKYKEFKQGTHGKHKPSCVAAGCHDPHTPQLIYAQALAPFVGTGFQFTVLPTRLPLKPFAAPAPNPATVIPTWFVGIALVCFVAAAGFVGVLVAGRYRR